MEPLPATLTKPFLNCSDYLKAQIAEMLRQVPPGLPPGTPSVPADPIPISPVLPGTTPGQSSSIGT